MNGACTSAEIKLQSEKQLYLEKQTNERIDKIHPSLHEVFRRAAAVGGDGQPARHRGGADWIVQVIRGWSEHALHDSHAQEMRRGLGWLPYQHSPGSRCHEIHCSRLQAA